MLRMIASDMDGTLLSDHYRIHEKALLAIHLAQAQGVHFVVATGRAPRSARAILDRHGIRDATIIGVNGCLTEDPDGTLLDVLPIERETAAACLAIFRRLGLSGGLFTKDALLYQGEDLLRRWEGIPEGVAIAAETMAEGVRIIHEDSEAFADPAAIPLKAFCVRMPGQEEAFQRAKAACAALPGADITSSWVDNFEVMPKDVHKGAALSALCRRLGIAREDVIAFGDNENDLTMLTWAGIGYAMENALPQVKAAADAIVGPCHGGGVGEGIYLAMGR